MNRVAPKHVEGKGSTPPLSFLVSSEALQDCNMFNSTTMYAVSTVSGLYLEG